MEGKRAIQTCVIDVGGGMRGVYASAVLDRCLDLGICFDTAIGISAGSANLASFLAGQRGRNFVFYTDYASRWQYMSLRTFLRTGSYLDLQYVYGTLSHSDGEYPLDYERFQANPTHYYAIATDAQTGKPRYFTKQDIWQDHYHVFAASSSIPVACRPTRIQGREYYDGALGDPIPVDFARSLGCNRIVLILTRPAYTRRRVGHDETLAKLLALRYPKAAEQLSERARHYNAGVYKAKQLSEAGEVLIISPDQLHGASTLTHDKAVLQSLYDQGYRDGEKIVNFLK